MEALNGGCYLDLETIDNIASEWEYDPVTMRVRVKAPKTKEEPYPDYDKKETESAEQVSRLCNREIPVGSRYKSEDCETSEEGEDREESEGGEGSEESGIEEKTAKNTISNRNSGKNVKFQFGGGASNPDNRTGDGVGDDFIESELKPKATESNHSERAAATTTIDKSSKLDGRRVAKRALISAKHNRDRRSRIDSKKQNSQFVITSADYRARRAMLRDKSARRAKRRRRDYYSEGVSTSNDEFSDALSSDSSSDSELDYRRKRKIQRASSSSKRKSKRAKPKRFTKKRASRKIVKRKPVRRRKKIVTFPVTSSSSSSNTATSDDDDDNASQFSSGDEYNADSNKLDRTKRAAVGTKPVKKKKKTSVKPRPKNTERDELDSDFDCSNFWTTS